MHTQPQLDFNILAEKLVNAAAKRDFVSLAEVLTYLDPARVDVFVYLHGANAHLSIIGRVRSLYLPEEPHVIQQEPSIDQIAQLMEEVAR